MLKTQTERQDEEEHGHHDARQERGYEGYLGDPGNCDLEV